VGAGTVKVKEQSCVSREMRAEDGDPNKWFLDSGCTVHMTPYIESLNNFNPNATGTVNVAKKSEKCKIS
jgi:hypothetical protein